MKINPAHTIVCYGPRDYDNTVYLTNIEQDNPIDLISFPCPTWGDRATYGTIIRKLGVERGLC